MWISQTRNTEKFQIKFYSKWNGAVFLMFQVQRKDLFAQILEFKFHLEIIEECFFFAMNSRYLRPSLHLVCICKEISNINSYITLEFHIFFCCILSLFFFVHVTWISIYLSCWRYHLFDINNEYDIIFESACWMIII